MPLFLHEGPKYSPPSGTINLILAVDPKVAKFGHNFPRRGQNDPLSVTVRKERGNDTREAVT